MSDGVKDFGIMVLYALAAISGGMGGCATALNIMKHGHRHVSLAFICAYTVLGIVFGILTLAALFVLGHPPKTIHECILASAVGGSLGSVVLVAANYSAKIFFRKMGITVQVTLRKDIHEERRHEE